MTEAPDVYPDFPDDDEVAEAPESDDEGVEGRLDPTLRASDLGTGDPRVDVVLESLADLEDLPVGEHAPVFEAAHERLRAALDPDQEPERESV
jgi:hypothetical protein